MILKKKSIERLMDLIMKLNYSWMRTAAVRIASPSQSNVICCLLWISYFYRPTATACLIKMLLGAWPIGGNKRPGHSNATDRNGKCRFLLLCGSYGLFLIVGAAIFSVIEAPLLDRYQRDLVDTKETFLQSNPCVKSKFIRFYAISFWTSVNF